MRSTLILIIILLTGCVAGGPKFNGLVDSSPKSTAVYLLRQSKSYGIAYCPPVSVDGNEIGCLRNGGFIRLELEPGKHEIRFEKRFLEAGKERFVEFEAASGETYFFEWSIAPESVWIVGSMGGVTGSEGIITHNQERALEILKELKES